MCTCYSSFFHIVSLQFNTTLPVVYNFFEPLTAELFRLYSKPFSHNILNFFSTCEMNGTEMFLESCKQPKVKAVPNPGCWDRAKQLQIRCNISPLNGSTSVGTGVIMLKKHQHSSPVNMIDILFRPV